MDNHYDPGKCTNVIVQLISIFNFMSFGLNQSAHNCMFVGQNLKIMKKELNKKNFKNPVKTDYIDLCQNNGYNTVIILIRLH